MRALAILLILLCACKSSTDYNTLPSNGSQHVAQTLLVGTADSASIYYTNDQGTTWHRAAIDLTGGQKIWSIIASGANLFCSSSGAGVFISRDNGATWTKLNYPGGAAQAMTVFDSSLYVADNFDGLYISSDDGFTWEQRSTQLAGSYVHGFAVSGATLLACTERRGVALSSNSGYFWSANDTNQTGVKDMHALAVNSRGIFAGASAAWLFRSTDVGTSWQSVSLANTTQNVWALLASDSMMYAASSAGVFRSNTGGLNWSPFTPTLSSEDVHALAFDGANLYAGTNGDGVFRSGDKGFTWTAINTGLGNRTISAMLSQ